MSASTSSVAVSPSGSPRPHISPTSRPTFSGLLTPTPTRSNSGWEMISGITILPTHPVPQTTIRLVMHGPFHPGPRAGLHQRRARRSPGPKAVLVVGGAALVEQAPANNLRIGRHPIEENVVFLNS